MLYLLIMKKADHNLKPFQVEYYAYDHTIEDMIYNSICHSLFHIE